MLVYQRIDYLSHTVRMIWCDIASRVRCDMYSLQLWWDASHETSWKLMQRVYSFVLVIVSCEYPPINPTSSGGFRSVPCCQSSVLTSLLWGHMLQNMLVVFFGPFVRLMNGISCWNFCGPSRHQSCCRRVVGEFPIFGDWTVRQILSRMAVPGTWCITVMSFFLVDNHDVYNFYIIVYIYVYNIICTVYTIASLLVK